MDDARWELLSVAARRERLADAVGTFSALAVAGRQQQDLGYGAYVYPTTLGEWLSHAVQRAGGTIWQASFIPLLLPDRDGVYRPALPGRESIREQAATGVLLFGATLWSGVMLARDLWKDQAAQGEVVEAISAQALELLDEVRQEQDGLSRATTVLGDALYMYAAHTSRGGQVPTEAIAAELQSALAWLAASVASTDLLSYAELPDLR